MSQTEKHSGKSARVKIIFVALAAAGFLGWWFFLRGPALPENVIAVSGRIEGDDSMVAAKTSGRIREITVREGDPVKAGQIIAVLDDDQIKARVSQAQSAVQQAEARVQWSRQQIGVLQASLNQTRMSVSQARLDAEGRVSQATAQVAAAEASLAEAKAVYEQARFDKERYSALARDGVVSGRESEQSITTAEAQEAVVMAAQKQLEATRGNLMAARAYLDNPAIRASEAAAIEQQIAQAQSDILSAQADAERARAQLREAEANREDLKIVAPFDGTVATRAAEPGEVVAAGTPIMKIVNLDQVHLRAFIPEGEIGRVRVGQSARVYLDSNPGNAIKAVVARVDPEASFTPENTYFRDDRVKQVVGVKLQIINPQGFAKPGMPADGEVLVEGSEWVAKSGR
ncbi:MAG TPA: HlyD family efflux transporter periplasmic adaptor subunit [Blastocatellia bacterium]|nr:HlyD family efflux transporter periplasmic adaptor subunit [Blastocatellia bacterium]